MKQLELKCVNGFTVIFTLQTVICTLINNDEKISYKEKKRRKLSLYSTTMDESKRAEDNGRSRVRGYITFRWLSIIRQTNKSGQRKGLPIIIE
jgi:hypothetical protein